MSVNFDELMSTKGSDVKRPRPLPVGHYIMLVKGHEFKKSKEKQTPYVSWNVEVQSATEDVDQQALAEWTQDFGSVTGRRIRLDHYITEGSLFRLNDFLRHVGLDMDNLMIKEAVPLAVGRMFKAQITQTPSGKAGDDSLYNEIQATLPMDG